MRYAGLWVVVMLLGIGSAQAQLIPGGGVTQIIAGTNVTISPSGGTGAVTVNASGGAAASVTVGTTTITNGTPNGLLYDNAGVLGNLATANNGVLVTSSGGAPSISTTLPNGLALGTPGSITLTNGTSLPLTGLAAQATNTVLGNATSGSASPTALTVGGCSSATSALIWTTNTGFGCNTAINAATLGGATFASPGNIGTGTAGSGAFSVVTINSSESTFAGLLSGDATSFTAGFTLQDVGTAHGLALRQAGGTAYGVDIDLQTSNGDLLFDGIANNVLTNAMHIGRNGLVTISLAPNLAALTASSGVFTDSSKNATSTPPTGYPTSVGTGLSVTSNVASSNAEQTLAISPGPLSSITNSPFGFTKFAKASTVDNITLSSLTLTCTGNPTIALLECGTSATCAGPTTIGSVTVTAAATATPATVSSSAITAGDYVAGEITAGTCASTDITLAAQIHSN